MPNLNKVMLMGNLTRDPEIKYTPKGTAIAAFGMAINRNYTLENGEKREEVTFVDCEAYARLAEIIGEYCKKGKPLFVEGLEGTEAVCERVRAIFRIERAPDFLPAVPAVAALSGPAERDHRQDLRFRRTHVAGQR